MLIKLLKYDLKDTSAGIISITLILMLASVLFFSFIYSDTVRSHDEEYASGYEYDYEHDEDKGSAILYDLEGYSLLAACILTVTTFLVPIRRFYRCIAKKEAYFSLTIPVPAWMHIASKLICTLIWTILIRLINIVLKSVLLLMFLKKISPGEILSNVFSFYSFGRDSINYVIAEELLLLILIVLALVFLQLFVYMAVMCAAVTSNSDKSVPALTFLYMIIGSPILGAVFSGYYDLIKKFGGSGRIFYLFAYLILAALSAVFFAVTARLLDKKYSV